MHSAYKPQRKAKLTVEEIKAGSPYTIEQLAEAAYTHVFDADDGAQSNQR